MSDTFGEMFKRLRIAKGKTLRAFCFEHQLDPGNISKLERGRGKPPVDSSILTNYATWLGLQPNSEEWESFMDLAAAATGRIPDDLMDDASLVPKLPVLFRTLRGTPIAQESLEELAERIRRA